MSINVQQLSLDLPCPVEMSDSGFPTYRADIRHFGKKVVIRTPEVEYMSLQQRMVGKSYSLAIQIDSWTRDQLNILESFVQANVVIPEDVEIPTGQLSDYRPVWPHAVAFITCSQRCNYYWRNPESDVCLSVKPEQLIMPGLFAFTIEVPYVYIGSHKGGERYSLVLRLLQVTYRPLTTYIEEPQALPPFDPEKSQSLQPTHLDGCEDDTTKNYPC